MGSETPWSTLHPASVLVNLIPQTWRVMRMAWPLLLAVLWRGESGMWLDAVDLGLVLFFFLATIGGTIKHWLFLRYRFHDGRLEIRSGVVYRRLRTIDPAKVQNVELVRNLFHTMSGLVEVRIETASGTEIEGDLSALNIEAAEALRRQLEDARQPSETEEVDGVPIVMNGWLELFRFGATAMRFGAAVVIFGIIFEGMTRMQPDELGQFGQMALGLRGAAVLVAVLSGAWLWGVITSMVRHYNFKLFKTAESLIVEGGLFTRRRLELPFRKVQVVSVSEPLIRRWAGFGSVVIETAAARSGQGGTERRAALAPVVESGHIPRVVAEAVPGMDVDPWSTPLLPPHRKALWRSMGRSVLRNVIVASALNAWFGLWATFAWILVPGGIFFAYLDYRHQGWLISPHLLTARSGYLTRSSVVVHRSKVQSVSCHQGIFMRRLGLGRMRVHVAGRGVSFPLLGWTESIDTVMSLVYDARAWDDDTMEHHRSSASGVELLSDMEASHDPVQ